MIYITWGGGGLGDPLTRPASLVAQEVHRRLVTPSGARNNYGVIVHPDFSVDERATAELRRSMAAERERSKAASEAQSKKATNGALTNGHAVKQGGESVGYNRGGTISELLSRCEAETGLKPPRPQWERDPYGPHTGLPYVREWYAKMREGGYGVWDRI